MSERLSTYSHHISSEVFERLRRDTIWSATTNTMDPLHSLLPGQIGLLRRPFPAHHLKAPWLGNYVRLLFIIAVQYSTLTFTSWTPGLKICTECLALWLHFITPRPQMLRMGQFSSMSSPWVQECHRVVFWVPYSTILVTQKSWALFPTMMRLYF